MNTGQGLKTQLDPQPTTDSTAYSIDLAKRLVNALHLEFLKLASAPKESPLEIIGLLFGAAAPSVKLTRFEVTAQIALPASSMQLRHTQVRTALAEHISKIGPPSPNEPATVLGWFVISAARNAGPIDSDIAIHNTLFQGPQNVMLLVRPESKDHFLLEAYAARPGMLLSQNDRRAGLWSSKNLANSPDPLTVPLHESGDDELFFNVYRTAKSLDKAESKGHWGGAVRNYTARLKFAFTSTAKAAPQHSSHFEPAATQLRDEPSATPDNLLPRKWPLESTQIARAETSPTLPSAAISDAIATVPAPASRPVLQSPPPAGEPVAGRLRSVAAWVIGTVLVSLFTYVIAHVYIKPLVVRFAANYQIPPKAALPAQTPNQEDTLDLRIEPRSNGLLEISWNRQSLAVQNAVAGTLWMTDKTHILRTIPLNGDDLKIGRVMYMPVSGDTTFHLKVTDQTGHETARWIRVLNDTRSEHVGRSAGATAAVQAARTEPQPAATPIREAAADVPAVPAADHPTLTPVSVPAPGAADSRNAPVPVVENRLQETRSSLPAAYVQHLASSLPLSGSESVQGPAKVPAVPAKATVTPDVHTPPANAATESTATNVHSFPPRIAFKYVPSLPVVLGEPVDISVPVLVSISPSGAVSSATITPQSKRIPKNITDSALSAAKKWRFFPATVNGHPVPSDMTLQFHFVRQP